jgi:hypothetical protein
VFLSKYTPFLPAHKQVVRSPEYFELMKNTPGLECFVNEIDQSPVEQPSLTSQRIIKVLAQELSKAFEGKCSPSEALQSAALAITQILNNPAIPWTELY